MIVLRKVRGGCCGILSLVVMATARGSLHACLLRNAPVCADFQTKKKAEKKKKEKISFFSSLDCRKVIISKNPTQKGESWGALHIDEQKNRRFFFNPLDKEEKIK